MLDFNGKKVTLMGLGQYKFGSGLSAARFLIGAGARLTITDLKTKEQMRQSVRELEKFIKKFKPRPRLPSPRLPRRRPSIKFVWGRHQERDFTGADWILRNPSVPNRSRYLELARKRRIQIDTDASLFLRLCPCPIIGITGTRGKSTTTALIYEIMKKAFALASKTDHRPGRVYLGGNILYSPLNFLKKLRPSDLVVLELSSWQTESFIPFKVSLGLAVITNLYPDHFTTYRSMAQYAAAKSAIFRFQKPSDTAVLNWDNQYTKKMAKKCSAKKFWFTRKILPSHLSGGFIEKDNLWIRVAGKKIYLANLNKIKLIGDHNRSNILAAATAAYLAGARPSAISQVIKNFPGLPNRLQLIRKSKGVEFYNDTTATTAEGTIAALKSFTPQKIVLIAGGSEKNLPFDQLAVETIKRVRALVLLDDEASLRIASEITKRKNNFPIFWSTNMKEAVKIGARLAVKGDVVLMSPACASFGLFKNEFDRGAQFVAAVKKIK